MCARIVAYQKDGNRNLDAQQQYNANIAINVNVASTASSLDVVWLMDASFIWKWQCAMLVVNFCCGLSRRGWTNVIELIEKRMCFRLCRQRKSWMALTCAARKKDLFRAKVWELHFEHVCSVSTCLSRGNRIDALPRTQMRIVVTSLFGCHYNNVWKLQVHCENRYAFGLTRVMLQRSRTISIYFSKNSELGVHLDVLD